MDNISKTYGVEGMHCAGCVASVEKSLLGLKGVHSALVNLILENVSVETESSITFVTLNDAVQSCGYTLVEETVEEFSERKEEEIHIWRRRLIFNSMLGIPLLIIAMSEMMQGKAMSLEIILLQLFLTTPIMIISRHFYINGFMAFFHKNPNMNSLVALGTCAAYIYSLISSVNLMYEMGIAGFDDLYFESAGIILVFITLGRYLEAHARSHTSKALFELLKKAPRTGWIKKEGKWLEVSVQEIKEGDEVMIKPGGQIPVDGVVIEGTSFINEAALTGEAIPVEKHLGDILMGASINTSGILIMKADKVGEETLFSQIVQLVEDTQNTKAPIQSLADKVASIFVPVVLALAVISFTGWLIAGMPLVFSINILITVLIIACPCALGLATPTAIAVGTGKGAKIGIHYKSARALQQLNEITTVVFDKTGTLTMGKPRVVDSFSAGKKEDFIYYLASVEQGSEHPLSEAIMNLASIQKIKPGSCTKLEVLPGKGIQGEVRAKKVLAGSFNWIRESGISIPADISEKVQVWEAEGKTIIHTAVHNSWIGMVSIEDTLRKESAVVVGKFQRNGMQVCLLTGDRIAPAEYFAKKVGIKKVYSEILPVDKARVIRELQNGQYSVAMIGDGINDAPALAEADVGIALGSGTDVAMETSDVVILRNDLYSVFNAWKLSQSVIRKIKQNLFWAFVYNMIGIPIAMGILYPFSGYLLNPILAGAAMAFSSVSVVVNTLLLRKS